MKKSLLLFLIVSAVIAACAKPGMKETAFYVSTQGNDSWSGKLAEPAKDGADGPFATLEKARDAVRALKQTGTLPQGGVTVYIHGGSYELTKTFELTTDDSGMQTSPILWRASPGEKVMLVGGKEITNFKPVEDPGLKKRLAETCRDSVLEADLNQLGISDYGDPNPKNGKKMYLFFQGKFMTIARYPDEEWLTVADVTLIPGKIIKGDPRTEKPDGSTRGQHSGKLKYDDKRPSSWDPTAAEDMWVHGYWYWDWRDEFHKVAAFNPAKKEFTLTEPFHFYGYRKGQRFYFLNVLEELNAPGEYFIDSRNGKLYFYPPAPIAGGGAYLALLEQPLVSLKETSFIKIQGLTFMVSRGGAVTVEGGEKNTIAGCAFTNFGQNVVSISGGKENSIIGCDIFEVATGCISITGGDRKTLTPAGNSAVNNHIYDYCRIMQVGGAVSLQGVGNKLSHNKIHNAPHHAVNFGGNENIIEYNEIYDVLKETDDAGAVYSGRDWTLRGNVIQYNYFHDIKSHGKWGMSVYLDDCYCSALVYGNMFYKAGKAVLIGGGQYNTVENNVFVDCDISIHVDGRGMWDEYYLRKLGDGDGWGMYERLAEIDYKNPPWSTKYPEVMKTVEDPKPPLNNVITRNVSFGSRFLDFYRGVDFTIVRVENNLIADKELCNWHKVGEKEAKMYTSVDAEIMERLKNNVIIDTDPGFVDIPNGNFNLKEDSEAWKLGFKAIPFNTIGLYIDEYRTSLP